MHPDYEGTASNLAFVTQQEENQSGQYVLEALAYILSKRLRTSV